MYEIIAVAKAGGAEIDTKEVTRTLQDVEDYSGPKQSLVDTQLIRKTFWDFDWSGRPAPVVVEAPVIAPVESKPVYTPVADILSIYFMQEDTAHPELSRAFVSYKSSSGVTGEAAEGSVVIRVADTGCGIAAEDLEQVFMPFFTTKEKGTGLGLAAAAKTIEAHGGSIRVTSEIGNGTTFEIALPGGM